MYLMQIIKAAKEDFPRLQDFLTDWEESCVTLASYIRRKKENIYIVSKQKAEEIFGIFYFDKTLLFCFPFINQLDKESLSSFKKLIVDFIKKKNLKCLNGNAQAGNIIIQALEETGLCPYQTNHYKTMLLNQEPLPPPEKLSCDDEIKRCSNSQTELELLLPLQKMYLAKEVAPAGKQVTDLEASAQLKAILKDQLCFALWSDGEIVAKANTNAIGFNYVQLGGVYTHPLYRKNYYAWHLVYTICSRVLKSGRNISLFVKDRNNPAHELYEKLGFDSCGQYIIAYYK